jgi:hypothetical protein
MVNGSASTFALSNGKLEFTLSNQLDGAISGTNGLLEGLLTAEQDQSTVGMKLRVSNATLSRSPLGATRFAGLVHADMQPGWQFGYVIPFQKGYSDADGTTHDAFRLFPTALTVSLASTSSSNNGHLTFTNTQVNLDSLVFTPNFRLAIPAGKGEHEDSDDPNSADSQHGPDDQQHWQEVVTDIYPACRVHIYAAPATYDVASRLKLSIVDNALALDISHFVPTAPIAFSKDGCDPTLLGTVVGAIAGFIVAGPAGGVAGAAYGNHVGNDLEDTFNGLIAGNVASRIASFSKSWRVQIPQN